MLSTATQRAENNPLRVHLAEAPAIVLVSDSEETRVELMWKTLLTFDERSDVSSEIRCSFGDPLHRVRRFSESIDRVAARPPFYLGLEATLADLVFDLPMPDLPWDENFADSDMQSAGEVHVAAKLRKVAFAHTVLFLRCEDFLDHVGD